MELINEITAGWIVTSATKMLLAGYPAEYVAEFIARFERRLDVAA